jgi:hypothetical protein
MQKLLTLTGALIMGLVLSLSFAVAAPDNFCRSYARIASAQYEESRANGCGLFGGRWQESLDAHYNWCLGSPIAVVENEEDYRNGELRTCRRNQPVEPPSFEEQRRAACKTYATVAAQQNETQELLRCGFRGGRWQSNKINHFNWCVSAAPEDATQQNATRERDVRQCKRDREQAMQPDKPRFGFTIDFNFGPGQRAPVGPKASFCRSYAQQAVKQNQRQDYLGCGYFGNRWRANPDTHFSWCMSNPRTASLAELDSRKRALVACETQ